ncbi:MAG: rod shape-determining protein RodA [Rhodothermales bacterium]|nr:rod shape-determining protein RodA [Rhodothermales bacterium]
MRVWYRNFSFDVVLVWAALVCVGLIAIYSTTNGPASEFLLESVRHNFFRQSMWALICSAGIGFAFMLPVRFFQNAAWPAYVITLLLLVAALVVGTEINGARSWIRIGPLQLQVSELAKVGTILAVAQLLSAKRARIDTVRYALYTAIVITIPGLLIVLQNDTGTALVFFALVPIMLFWSGLPLINLMLIVSPAVAAYLSIVYLPAAFVFAIAFTLLVYYQTREFRIGAMAGLFTLGTTLLVSQALPKLLQPHQVARLLSFTNPGSAEFRDNVGFHLVQSKAAIGSGGLTGKGFMEGTQTQGAYVPEQSTDFVFSVIGEEFGFIGSVIVLTLFTILLLRLISLGVQMKHPFGLMVAAGTVGVYLIHIFVNIGMATGLLPVIGIPLPFISYGGSALLAHTAMLAILLSLHLRKDDFSIYGY